MAPWASIAMAGIMLTGSSAPPRVLSAIAPMSVR